MQGQNNSIASHHHQRSWPASSIDALTPYTRCSFNVNSDINFMQICYTNCIRPLIEYANVVYANVSIQDSNKLENLQNEAMRIISGAKRLSSNTAL